MGCYEIKLPHDHGRRMLAFIWVCALIIGGPLAFGGHHGGDSCPPFFLEGFLLEIHGHASFAFKGPRLLEREAPQQSSPHDGLNPRGWGRYSSLKAPKNGGSFTSALRIPCSSGEYDPLTSVSLAMNLPRTWGRHIRHQLCKFIKQSSF